LWIIITWTPHCLDTQTILNKTKKHLCFLSGEFIEYLWVVCSMFSVYCLAVQLWIVFWCWDYVCDSWSFHWNFTVVCLNKPWSLLSQTLPLIPVIHPTRYTCHLKLFIFVKCCTRLGRSFRPSSGAQNCVYMNGICQTAAATCCYRGWVGVLVKCSTCFGPSFHPSSGAQNCIYSNGICQTAAATCCYRGWVGSSCKMLYVFRTVFPSIIRSSKLHIQQRYMSNTCSYLLLSGMRWSSSSSPIAAAVWHILLLYTQFWAPDDGRKDRPKHVERFTINNLR
jgi:hypothetical protein